MAVWDPLLDLERLRREMDQIFEAVAPPASKTVGFLPGGAARQYPRVNVTDVGEAYLVEALAPGADPTSLELSVKEGALTIRGEKRAAEGVSEEAYHRAERLGGRFVRTVEIPRDADTGNAAATYAEGILQVRLPKAEKAKARQIEISVG